MSYSNDGYVLVENAIPVASLDALEAKVLGLLEEETEVRFESTRSPEFSKYLADNREVERRIYDEVRKRSWVPSFCSQEAVASEVRAVLGTEEIGLMQKIPLRFDLPLVTRELAVWHQDFFYVKGNEDIVTAWIPLQDTPYEVGCLMVMPGSQQLGAVPHDAEVLGKRHFPKGVFHREVRYVEMKRGDLLLFDSLLLHSSGVNMSNRARLSLQARFTRLADETHSGMGEVLPVTTAVG